MGLAGTVLAAPAAAGRDPAPRPTSYLAHAGSFYLQQNQPPGREGEPTSAEIIAFDRTGDTLLYTDGLTGRLGFVDTSDVADPRPAGTLQLPGDPTSVAVQGPHALVAVVTSENPDGDGFAAYPLDPVESPAGGWVGLSELTLLRDGTLAVLERDNQLGLEARVKRVYRVDPASVGFAPAGGPLPLLEKSLVADLLPGLDAASVAVPDKVEGLGLTRDGRVFLVTDNDGVDENYGETVFRRVRLGPAG